MKLQHLLEVLEPGTAFAIECKGVIKKYSSRYKLEDSYYCEIEQKTVCNIWHSKILYECIVIEIE